MIVQINHVLKDIIIPVIIIDPYAKKVGLQQGTGTHTAINNSNTVSKSSEISRPTVTKKNRTVPVAPSAKKTTTNKSKITTKTASKKDTTKKTSIKKLEPKKNIKKPAVVKKKDAPPVKKQEFKPIKKEESNKTVQTLPEMPIEQATVAATIQHDISAYEGPILIARSSQEATALTVQVQIQHELLRVWHPPLGIDDSVMCKMQLKINASGCIEQIDMIQSSGTLLFDVSAHAAVQQALWPHAVWGTTLELILQ